MPLTTPVNRMPGATDTLVFRVSPCGLSLVGGSGRGEGWSGIVDVAMANAPLVARMQGSSRPARIGGGIDPVHVLGPYWARNALLVPVGAEHLVVFGGDEPMRTPDSAVLPLAAQIVAELGEVSPEKLLADELELVHAIRDLMDYRPESVAATARHIALRAAEALSCEVGAILLRHDGHLTAEVVTRDWPAVLDPEAIRGTLVRLFERTETGALLELQLSEEAGDALGREQGLVARFALPIGGAERTGVLVLAHAAAKARGFTNLCQRIGHALAEAADSLLAQAASRENLAAERDRLAREAHIDSLTGLDNRAAWDELVEAEETRRSRYLRPTTIVSVDLDNLKQVNDRFGHAVGDRMLRAAADCMRKCARGADHVARVGGDEFLILMPETDGAGAAQFLTRVRSAARRVNIGDDICLQLSVGSATAESTEPLITAVGRADDAMYAAKKRRRGRCGAAVRS